MPVTRGVKIGIVGTICTGMLGVASYGAYRIISAVTDSGGGSGGQADRTNVAPTPAASPDASEVARTAGDFPTAWSSGDTTKAARLTDSVQTATAGLTDCRTNGHIVAVTATPPGIPSGVSAHLRAMMHSALAYGTAGSVMRGFGPDSGARTGSAEVGGQAATDGWFTALSGHLAATAVVHDAGHGNASAGPVVAAVLRAG